MRLLDKIELLEFGIHGKDGKIHLGFKVRHNNEIKIFDDMLRIQNKEDTEILVAMQNFVMEKLNPSDKKTFILKTSEMKGTMPITEIIKGLKKAGFDTDKDISAHYDYSENAWVYTQD